MDGWKEGRNHGWMDGRKEERLVDGGFSCIKRGINENKGVSGDQFWVESD